MRHQNIRGFIVGPTNDPYFMIQRDFTYDSKLREYLKRKFPTKVNDDRCEYTMREILELIGKIVENEALYDENNPYIIICDNDLAEALEVHALFTTDTYEFVEQQLPPRIYQNTPYKQYEGMTSSNHLSKLSTPKWASKEATAVKAFKKDITQTYADSLFKPTKNLEKFLIEQCHRRAYETYNIFEAIAEVTNYLAINEENMIKEQNPRVVIIKDTPLQDALEVGHFDMLQIIHLVRNQLDEIDTPVYTIPTGNRAKPDTERHNTDEEENKYNIFLRHLNKTNKRTKQS